MEEKERYKLESHNGTFCEFHDTETDEWYIRKDLVTDLLNQQDKDIKKLRQENQQLKQQLAESERKLEEYKKCNCKECMTDYEKNLNQIIDKHLNENIKLKQQLHDLPKKIVEEIKIEMGSIEDILINCGNGKEDALSWFNKILQKILKKYGGEDE